MPLLTTRLIYTTVKQNVKPVSILKAVAKPGICLVCLVYPRDRHGEKQLTLAKLLTLNLQKSTKIPRSGHKWVFQSYEVGKSVLTALADPPAVQILVLRVDTRSARAYPTNISIAYQHTQRTCPGFATVKKFKSLKMELCPFLYQYQRSSSPDQHIDFIISIEN